MDIVSLIIGVVSFGLSVWAISVAKSVSKKYIAHFTLPSLREDLQKEMDRLAITLSKKFDDEGKEELNKILAAISPILSDLKSKIEKEGLELLDEIIELVSHSNAERVHFIAIQNKLISLDGRLKYQSTNMSLKVV